MIENKKSYRLTYITPIFCIFFENVKKYLDWALLLMESSSVECDSSEIPYCKSHQNIFNYSYARLCLSRHYVRLADPRARS